MQSDLQSDLQTVSLSCPDCQQKESVKLSAKLLAKLPAKLSAKLLAQTHLNQFFVAGNLQRVFWSGGHCP